MVFFILHISNERKYIMLTLEKKIVRIIEKNKDTFFFLIISFLGMIIRIAGKDFISKDMLIFLNPWFESIRLSGGLKGLSSQVGDYNILYQTIIALFTYINVNPIYLYKILSCIFDFLLAYYGALFICELSFKPKYHFTFNCTYTMLLFLPTVILNSSFWGQCDAIYTLFCILTLRNIYKGKYTKAFIYFGIAFAFKLQAIFIVPFIICYYLYKKNFSIFYFLISALILELSGIPGFLAGRSLTAPWSIYLFQTREQPVMNANMPNLWSLMNGSYDSLKTFAIILTICILGIGAYWVLSHKKTLSNPEDFLNFACWIIWTCVLFLPVMHERYAYGLEILLFLLCFINKIYIPFAAVSEMTSIITYSHFLFDITYAEKPTAIIFLLAYLFYTYIIYLCPQDRQNGN